MGSACGTHGVEEEYIEFWLGNLKRINSCAQDGNLMLLKQTRCNETE